MPPCPSAKACCTASLFYILTTSKPPPVLAIRQGQGHARAMPYPKPYARPYTIALCKHPALWIHPGKTGIASPAKPAPGLQARSKGPARPFLGPARPPKPPGQASLQASTKSRCRPAIQAAPKRCKSPAWQHGEPRGTRARAPARAWARPVPA